MKKILIIALLLANLSTYAQTNNDDVTIVQSLYGKGKKELITETMKLSAEEAAKFWPVYDKYEDARRELGKKRIANINEYAKNYESLSPEKASELVNAALDNQQAFSQLLQKTYKDMSKAINPLRAAQFVQVESYLESVIRMKIADELPFIPDVPHRH